MDWNNKLYCTHPFHVVRFGKPEHISKKRFHIKKCGDGPCKWLTISYEPKKIVHKKDDSEIVKDLKTTIQQKDKLIKILNNEVILLNEKLDDVEFRYNKIMSKLL